MYHGDQHIGLLALLHAMLMYRQDYYSDLTVLLSSWCQTTLHDAIDIFNVILIHSHNDLGIAQSLGHIYSNLSGQSFSREIIDSLASEVMLTSKKIHERKVINK